MSLQPRRSFEEAADDRQTILVDLVADLLHAGRRTGTIRSEQSNQDAAAIPADALAHFDVERRFGWEEERT